MLPEQIKCSYKSILAFKVIQIKGNMGFESALVTFGEGLRLSLEIRCKGISSDAMVKHQANGHGATCSNFHSCSSFVFFSRAALVQGIQEGRNGTKKANEINTC